MNEVTSNDVKKGTKVFLAPVPMISNAPRIATVMDNMRGVSRMVKIEERDGYFGDIGSVYVDEILAVIPDDFETTGISIRDCVMNSNYEDIMVSDAHWKKLRKIRQAEHDLFGGE